MPKPKDPIRPAPCEACPYRKDVPSGIWAPHEYMKLHDYDKPTHEQPPASFACHAGPDQMCHGWAVVHSNRGHENQLLALRIRGITVVPKAAVPLFKSGTDAAVHGLRDVRRPKKAARDMMDKLLGKHPRLRTGDSR